ncbi:MAG: aldo/keto reductase family protein [Actinobacteria bacterium]|jgi:voltage-dependent potassium channel beta subunit|nr:aldo/keto reductase family protein [Actinomycetota bacterium]
MQYRFLGNSGFKVSAISYGNWLTHGSQIEADQAIKTVHAAYENGITTFDTADVYAGTKAEVVLADAIKGFRREGIELFTKVYWPIGEGVNDRGLSRKHVMEAINGSLRRLKVDYVDLYQAHRFDHETPLEETMRAFEDIVRSGKALYIGVSEWSADQIQAAVDIAKQMNFDKIVSNQPQYSMLWRVIEGEVVPTSVKNGISQIVWSPMAQGVLTGKYLPGQPAPAGSRATDAGGARMIERWMRDDVLNAVQNLKPIAAELGISMGQLAIAWVLKNPNVASAIVGASRPDQIVDNIKAIDVVLDDAVMKKIDDVVASVIERDVKQTVSPNPRA